MRALFSKSFIKQKTVLLLLADKIWMYEIQTEYVLNWIGSYLVSAKAVAFILSIVVGSVSILERRKQISTENTQFCLF